MTSLNSEIVLGKGNLGLAGVAILGHKIAGIAGEKDVVNRSLGSFGKIDHFADVRKMF